MFKERESHRPLSPTGDKQQWPTLSMDKGTSWAKASAAGGRQQQMHLGHTGVAHWCLLGAHPTVSTSEEGRLLHLTKQSDIAEFLVLGNGL